jgi:hypothetical protein
MTQDDERRAESIRHRIRNELRARGEDVGIGLQRYAVERFLYRLGRSRHRERFILKGGMLFAIWGRTYRPTRDVDFTGYGSPEAEDVTRAIREICATPDDVDQLVFETDAITVESIRDGSEYSGLRIGLRARLGSSGIPLQIDIGFGNAIVPGPEETEIRTILGDPQPRILAYPRESAVAEKLHAMVTLGERNSRYKDFYDLHAIATGFAFERDALRHAVRATFERRATPVSESTPAALSNAFYSSEGRAVQWRAYLRNKNLSEVPDNFSQVGDRLILFLQPIWRDIAAQSASRGDWPPGGPWQ